MDTEQQITDEKSFEDGSSAATAFSGTTFSRASNTGIKLLDLTPVCLQNTDNILTTLIFMCLDQGHDFRDGGSRTLIGRDRGWVDADYNNDSYLNKLTSSQLSQLTPIIGGDGNDLNPEQIFGQYEFMTGLLKTTFAESNGAFGIVLIEDEEWKKLGFNDNDNKDDNTLWPEISQLIKQNIRISLNNNHIISTSTSGKKDTNGLNLVISHNDNNANILFLNFYIRCFNDGMHKLWDFTTRKHLYIISLNKINIVRGADATVSVNDAKTEFDCKKITELDLIVPQYRLNLGTEGKQVSLLNQERITKGKKTQQKGELYIEDKPTPEDEAEVYRKLREALFSRTIHTVPITTNLDEETAKSFGEITHDGIPIYIIPRGTRFWFDISPNKIFKNIVKLLYKHQTPFIHPDYKISNDSKNSRAMKIEQTKNTIFNALLSTTKGKLLLDYYSEIKTNPQDFLKSQEELITQEKDDKKMKEGEDIEPGQYFILKQYGIVPDTSIGTKKEFTTADYLINSLNNVPQELDCKEEEEPIIPSSKRQRSDNSGSGFYGGAGEFDRFAQFLDSKTKMQLQFIKGKNFNFERNAIEKVLNYLIKENKDDIVADFMEVLKQTFKDKSDKIDEIFQKNKMDTARQPSSTIPSLSAAQGPHDFTFNRISSTPLTTHEDISAATSITPPTAPVAPVIPTAPPSEIDKFNNIDNVNKVFKLSDTVLRESPFVEINSKTPNLNIDKYIDEYSNDIQLYYDYIRQKTEISPENNYFNNCWQSINFFQEGGSNYPYQFTITSGQMDSSKLGGQSIPQYFPPEIDIYMTIFDLKPKTQDDIETEPKDNLKGIIARMVVVKEVLNNGINIKGQSLVFCHFVYVDFERTGISPPKDYREYSKKIKELLDYVIEHTYYVKEYNGCINIENLKSINVNADDNIDFELRFDQKNPTTGNPFKRKWYKYYSYTMGPSVKTCIVKPTNGKSITAINSVAKANSYVAQGIVNAAQSLIRNSQKLREAFNIPQTLNDDQFDVNPGAVLFVKLFLIRNKYTGDKSRATDALFLNQTKYLEGIQVSNDENTLYNAMMFGQNTIWSTSTKTVFNMAPYYTKYSTMPVTGGFYIKELCEGLRQNENIKYDKKQESETGDAEDDIDEEKIIRRDTYNDIMSQMDIGLLDNIRNCKGQSMMDTSQSFVNKLIDGIVELDKLNKKFDEIKEYYEYFDTTLAENYEEAKKSFIEAETVTSKNISRNTGGEIYNNIEVKIMKKFEEFEEIFGRLKNISSFSRVENKNYSSSVYVLFGNAITSLRSCGINVNRLFKIILYLSKNFPWWISANITNYKNIIDHYYCMLVLKFISKLKELNTAIMNDANNTNSVDKKERTKKALELWIDGKYKLLKEQLPNSLCLPDLSGNITDYYIQQVTSADIPKIDTLQEVDKTTSSPLQIKFNDAQFDEVSLDFLKLIEENLQRNNEKLENYYEVDQSTGQSTLELAIEKQNEILQNGKTITQPLQMNEYIKAITRRVDSETPFAISQEPTGIRETATGGFAPKFEENTAVVTKRSNNSQYSEIMSPNLQINKFNMLKNKEVDIQQLAAEETKSKQLSAKVTEEDKANEKQRIAAEGVKSTEETTIKTTPPINKEELINFYKNSYKNNVFNYLKDYIFIIENIDMKYQDKQINFNTNTVQEILIKILLFKIDDINNSYVPAINSKNIIEKLKSINTSLSVEMLNTISNYYSQQLSLYSIINIIINADYENQDEYNMLLKNLIYENIPDYYYKQFKLSFTKDQLLNKLLTQSNNDNEENEDIETSNPQTLIQSGTVGGVSIKNKKYIKNNKTRNNKFKNKKLTIKKRNNKIKRNTRRH